MKNSPESTKRKLTKKDLRSANLRWMFTSALSWNYETMMAPGYVGSMMPVLKKLYGDDPAKMQQMMRLHAEFFNTSPHMGSIIQGIDIALEEKEGTAAEGAVRGLKTGLMGPFAAVGDTLLGTVQSTIFGAIASYLALQGNPIGAIIWMVALGALYAWSYTWMNFSYKRGLDLVTTMSSRLSALTEAATLLGVTVVGALIPTVVKANVPFVFKAGKVTLKVQDTLNQIMPALLPIALVAFVYWLLDRKGMNSNRAIWLMLVLAIVLYNLKILG
ncbi:PTS system mannose/fructose/sorbose family transporter subunit IID [Lacticaseibacillus rhamnosus]|nr:PTS system mannose/fructose/sorbose family transporter subunit IID [Lacticaseibacillus rhamnosus]MDF3335691.1 PTS system mannose/fructose/sorbose family transporter subunit IID [Lacticaseibacillus rhamnosus]